jgi:serine/threonine protein kinase
VVAVKAFRQSGDRVATDWTREVNALADMNELKNNNIVRFMTAFNYVMFEWADGGNLDNFWEELPTPALTASLTTWVVKQLHGLAEALAAAHSIGYRHGDLKPANILWFRGGDDYGTLKIGDWGEAKGHDIATALRHNTTARYATRRYEPPETGLQSSRPPGSRHARSRLYDIWGLGCITLEFVIWLLYGRHGLKTFNKSNEGNYGHSSMFYEINSAGRIAKVHPVVTHWMQHMAKDRLCRAGQTAIGDILDVVRTGLLVVQRSEDGGTELQPGQEQVFDTQNNTPSINITGAELTSEPSVLATSESRSEKGRILATELVAHLFEMRQRAGEERYWYQAVEPGPAPRDKNSSPLLTAPATSHRPRSNSASLGVPNTRKTDYEHPRLDPADWQFQLDNKLAAEILPQLGCREGSSSMVLPKLCANCRNFAERAPNPLFQISYDTKILEQNAKAGHCDLCNLLWKTYRKNSNHETETVDFQRVESTLTMSQANGKNPVLLLFRSNGKPAL